MRGKALGKLGMPLRFWLLFSSTRCIIQQFADRWRRTLVKQGTPACYCRVIYHEAKQQRPRESLLWGNMKQKDDKCENRVMSWVRIPKIFRGWWFKTIDSKGIGDNLFPRKFSKNSMEVLTWFWANDDPATVPKRAARVPQPRQVSNEPDESYYLYLGLRVFIILMLLGELAISLYLYYRQVRLKKLICRWLVTTVVATCQGLQS